MKLFVVACLVLILCGVSLASETEKDTVLATKVQKDDDGNGNAIKLPVGRGDIKAEAEFLDDIKAALAQEAAVSIGSSVAMDDSSNIQGGDCSCNHYQCTCCHDIKISFLKIDSNVCIEVEYLSSSIGVSVSLSVDGKVLIKKTASLTNPPPICAPLARAKICIDLYDISVSSKQVSGCGQLKAKFFGITLANFKLGCFNIPLSRAVYVRTPEGVLYLMDLQDAEK